MVFDPEAVGYGIRALIEARLESGRSPGQVLGARMTVMIGHVLAQPAPERVYRHQIRAVARQRHERDSKLTRDLLDCFGPVIGRPVPHHEELAIRHLGPQAPQRVYGVAAIGPRIGLQPQLSLIVDIETVEGDLRGQAR